MVVSLLSFVCETVREEMIAECEYYVKEEIYIGHSINWAFLLLTFKEDNIEPVWLS